MSDGEKPWWHDMYQKAQADARERTLKLIATSKVYPRPPRNPDIIPSSVDNRIAMLDTKTGDFLVGQTIDRERRLSLLKFVTKSGKLVCAFWVQEGAGFFEKWDKFPIRVYAMEESENQTDEVREARGRISIERLAEYFASDPDYIDRPSAQFIVIDAPVQPGERL